jgi:bacterioferritin
MYNKAVALATKLGDNGTKMLLESILTDEEAHIDLIESQLSMVEQMGLENYLNLQV